MKLKVNIGIVVDNLEDKIVIFNSNTNEFVEFNDIGQFILNYIIKNSFFNENDVYELLSTQYEIKSDKKSILEDISVYIEELLRLEILIHA